MAEKETLLEWQAPARPFKKRNKEYYKTIAAFVFLLVVILVFLKEFLLIGAILALFFVSYVLSTIPPEKVKHKITRHGFETGGQLYWFEELFDFWFEKKWGQEMVVIRSFRLPGRILALLGEVNKEELKKVLEKRIPFREKPEKNWTDKAGDWLAKKMTPKEKTEAPVA